VQHEIGSFGEGIVKSGEVKRTPSGEVKRALPDLVGLLYHVNQQLESRLSLKPHLDVVDNDI
jgi:hypothetical protein